MPISFFKSFAVTDQSNIAEFDFFSSSGTSQQSTSKHYVPDMEIYRQSFSKAFELFYGPANNYAILGLLPGYLERSSSSLILMTKELIEKAKPGSGFYLNEYPALLKQLEENEAQGIKTLLIGVTFALISFAEYYKTHASKSLTRTTIMETGGMKGRGREMTRFELHEFLCSCFGTSEIHSEYGMTELLSQAYSKGQGKFFCPPWMKISIQDPTDPKQWLADGKTGRICVTDLANIHSCSFIATDDLGKTHPDGSFEVLGRLDFSDLRGCNLMVV